MKAKKRAATKAPPATLTDADYVLENILGSMIGSAVLHAEKGKRRPTAAGYRKILIADLAARGWSIQRTDTPA
jgi:hypothetical protein